MLLKRSLQRELDSFFKSISGSDFSIREVTKSALSQARAKLKPYAFIRLNEVVVDTFYAEAEFNVWKGHRVLAVDGSGLQLPHHRTVKEAFGEYVLNRYSESPRSMALVSMLYDTLNQLTLDAQIESYSCSESTLLRKHFSKLMEGDLLLLDRGYPSVRLLYELQQKRVHFCMRMKESWWKEVGAFCESKLFVRLGRKVKRKIRRKNPCYSFRFALWKIEVEILPLSLKQVNYGKKVTYRVI